MIRRPPRSTLFPYTRSSDLIALDQPVNFVGRKIFENLFFPRRSEEHTSELQSQSNLVCRLLLEKKKIVIIFFFNDTATTEIYTLSLHTLFRSDRPRPAGKFCRQEDFRKSVFSQ